MLKYFKIENDVPDPEFATEDSACFDVCAYLAKNNNIIADKPSPKVVVYGMNNKVGNRSYYDSAGQDYSFTKPYSEATAKIIDEEVSKLIEKAYARAKSILNKHKKQLIELANLLLEKEVIYKENLEKIFGKRKWTSFEEEKLKEMDSQENNKSQEADNSA